MLSSSTPTLCKLVAVSGIRAVVFGVVIVWQWVVVIVAVIVPEAIAGL